MSRSVNVKKQNSFKGIDGSITIEAVIIVFSITISLLVIINICSLLYQQTLIQSLAISTASSGAKYWSNPNKDMLISSIYPDEMGDNGLYWRVIDSDKDNKKENLHKFINAQLKEKSLLKNENIEVQTTITDLLVHKAINISIIQKYYIPMGNFFKTLGFKDYFELKAHSSEFLFEPAEIIRNTDFIMERISK